MNNEQGPAPAYVSVDLRFLSLLSASVGAVCFATIGGFLCFDTNIVRPYALGGALELLDYSIYAASVITFATCASKISFGYRRVADVLPRGNSGILRSVAIVAILVCLRGAIENLARTIMWDDLSKAYLRGKSIDTFA